MTTFIFQSFENQQALGVSLKRWLFLVCFLFSVFMPLDAVASRLWRVNYFLNPQDDRFAILNVGSEEGLEEGVILNSYRFHLASEEASIPFVQTGRMKVHKLERHTAIAEVVERGSEVSKSIFPDYPGIMAGDLLSLPTVVLNQVDSISRELTIPYFDLFVDPEGDPMTYELSEEGQALLEKSAAEFGGIKSGFLLIKGYTGIEGSAERNQVESHQRALTIKQFLVNRWAFDEDRIIAIGMGERSLKEPNQVPGQEKYNRRISLKVLPFSTQEP
ncbi:MAG: OmpA family protein [Deltaproteobacteria bacterium]|nr:OmpA family protein [Deltaproteobacteria bacterium]